ncbi:PREDICTED: probable protein phosphatase 2C 55 [Fragaria vesca subsp. vesca]|uniref:probable protein phosphatase 2C 55 n=1 Tax=Fragaria vesca subsp. vesca TaxID=101020 RepID=UPI0002C340C0|nr:PREDICTED: probable protein phosphatase 2C 55 [Fragaria vesca subsp. vesca]
MDLGAYYLPKKGEDAHFIFAEEQTIGVVDGVGSWASKGVDAGEYSRELMRNSEKAIHNHQKSGQEINPIKVLEEAYINTKHIKLGSSTACIMTLKNTKHGSVRSSAKATLHVANIGDSGFMVFRKNHNSSYELRGNGKRSDDPDLADEIEIIDLIEAEDVIVVATDGLFDNVFPYEIGYIMNHRDFKTEKPEELAERIGRFAAYKSKDKHCDSPFASVAYKS